MRTAKEKEERDKQREEHAKARLVLVKEEENTRKDIGQHRYLACLSEITHHVCGFFWSVRCIVGKGCPALNSDFSSYEATVRPTSFAWHGRCHYHPQTF